jgi:hypothetical protein
MSKRKQKRKQARSVEVRLRFLGAHIEGFRSWLRRNGYRSTTIVELVRLFACWTEWLPAAGFALDLDNILIGFDASAPAFKGDRTKRAPRRPRCSFAIFGNKGRCCRLRSRHQRRRHGRYSEHSGPGCKASAASPRPRWIPTRPRLSTFSSCLATIQKPLRLTRCGLSFLSAPDRIAAAGPRRSQPRRARFFDTWSRPDNAPPDETMLFHASPTGSWHRFRDLLLPRISNESLPHARVKAAYAIGRSFCCSPALA